MDNNEKLQIENARKMREKYSSTNSVGDYDISNLRAKTIGRLVINNNSANNYQPFVSLTNNQLEDNIFIITGYQFQNSLALTLFRKANLEDRAKMIIASYQDEKLSAHKLDFLIHLTEEFTKEMLPAIEGFEKELEKIDRKNNFDYRYTGSIEEVRSGDALKGAVVSYDKTKAQHKVEFFKSIESKNSKLEPLEEEEFREDNSTAQKTLFQEMLRSNNFRHFLNAVSQNQIEVVSLMLEIADENSLYKMLTHKDLVLPDLTISQSVATSENVANKNQELPIMFDLLWQCAENLDNASEIQHNLLAQKDYEVLRQIIKSGKAVLVRDLCSKFLLMENTSIELQRKLANFAQEISPDSNKLDKIITTAILIKNPEELEESVENEVFLRQLAQLSKDINLTEVKENFYHLKNQKFVELEEKLKTERGEISEFDEKRMHRKLLREAFEQILEISQQTNQDKLTGVHKISFCQNLVGEKSPTQGLS